MQLTGRNIIGFETNNASAVAAIRTSTVSGTLYDVNRALGTMLIGGTDLVNNTANGNSFTPTQAPAAFQFGIINSLGNNQRYYLIPGTATTGNLTSEAKANPYSPAKAFPLVFSQPSTVIEINITYKETIAVGQAVTFYIYKNNTGTPVMSLILGPGENTKILTTQSVSFNTGDTMEVTLETTGNPSGAYPSFSAVVYYY
jgi:hypothetical protein